MDTFEEARAKIAAIRQQLEGKPKYTGVPYSETGPRVGSQLNRPVERITIGPRGGAGGGGEGGAAAELKMLNNPKAIKKGGKIRGRK